MTALPTRFAIAYVVADREDPGVAHDIDALEQSGQPLHVISLRHEPRFSPAIVFRAAATLLREPLRALRTPCPRAMHLAHTLRMRGITHVHAAGASATTMASAIARLLGARYTARALFPQPPSAISMLDLDWTALGARSLAVRWMSTRLDNAVAEVAVDDGQTRREVIVKRSFSAERARHEVASLTRLEGVGVPQVLHWDKERGTIVMERVPGLSLDRLFATSNREELLPAIRNAGTWLARMQAHTRSSSDASALLSTIVATAQIDAQLFRSRVHRRIVSRLQELARAVADGPLIVTGHHGDYWPGNLFIEGERVTVIDFEGFREGLPLEDVAYFLLRVELLARRFRIDAGGLSEAFLRGYGSAPEANALQLFTLTKGLRTLANNTGGNLPLPQRLWTRSIVRAAVMRYLR